MSISHGGIPSISFGASSFDRGSPRQCRLRPYGGSELNFRFHGPKHLCFPFRFLDLNLLMQNHPSRKPVICKASGRIFVDNLQNAFLNFGEASGETVNHDHLPQTDVNENIPDPRDVKDGDGGKESIRHTKYKNRLFIFLRLGSIINNAADSFFKSEIRRRICVTVALLLISRVGYYIPLPGFDRRLIPRDYLSFDSASAREDLINYSPELKMSLFQLGIGPQIAASIIMQMACHLIPSLVKLRKEGSDGYEKIKSYTWWISLGFAILGALMLGCFSLQYSIYEAGHRFKHVMMTTLFLTCGAMTMTWICDTITRSGFGEGSSLVICVGILSGYIDTLHKMLTQFSGNALSWWPYMPALLGIYVVVTMLSVVVTQGCRKVKLQYYGFKLASSARSGSPITEVEPYIPFNINPSGMQPVLTTSYLLTFPAILASLLRSPFWNYVKETLNPESSIGAGPWFYYSIYAFCVFAFNIFDIANKPKEIYQCLNKMGARIPGVKPGNTTVEYLAKIQASTRFWGGLLLTILATSSSILDHHLRHINESFSIGFTSVLLIVGSIIDLRRSYQAYNVMPMLSRVLRRYGV